MNAAAEQGLAKLIWIERRVKEFGITDRSKYIRMVVDTVEEAVKGLDRKSIEFDYIYTRGGWLLYTDESVIRGT